MTRTVQRTAASARFADFRNCHVGASIIVCGCGESLKELKLTGSDITIGVNDVGRLFDPTYLVVVNPRSQFRGDRFRHVETSRAQALFTQLDLGAVQPPVVRFRLGTYAGTDIDSPDVLHYTQNSPYVAVCLAVCMGATRIGLIGVDLTDNHFFAATGRHALAGRLREIDAQYGRLAAALGRRGVQLLNISSISRLTSLRRARIEDDGTWTEHTPVRNVAAVATNVKPASRGAAMTIAIGRASAAGAVGDLLNTLADTVAQLGHRVVRDTQATANDPRALSIVWNGRAHRARGATLYCEHGWLPRSHYQISPRGINADSHLAPFTWDGTPLSAAENTALDAHLAAIKVASFSGYYTYMQAAAEPATGLPPEFLLVPLQIEGDTNIIRHAPGHLRTMQALVDYVATADPPWPVIFKQHPADARRGGSQLRVRMRRRQDMVWRHADGNVHQMLKGGGCRGILTINSNVAHDGLLWDVPAIVLGKNIWPDGGAPTPFLTACPRDWSAMQETVTSATGSACRRAYAHFLMKHQWSLDDARDPRRVAALLAEAGPRALARRAATRPVIAARKTREPTINVVAENRGWLFEAWKQRYESATCPGFRIVPSTAPLRSAAAWIFIRAREAAATPDPARTIVQLHDLADAAVYGSEGERACVARCAAVSLTHAAQEDALAAGGIDLAARRRIVQPVGWSREVKLRGPAGAVPTLAWVGRPAKVGGVDVSGLPEFLDAVRGMRRRPRIVLVGERLENAARTLKQLHVDCRIQTLRACPLDRVTDWISRFHCVVIGGTTDSAPWPLFDALYAGVPVVARPVGWATHILADGACGRLADDAAGMTAAIEEVLGSTGVWQARRALLRERVIDCNISAWVQANLQLAAELARGGVVQAA